MMHVHLHRYTADIGQIYFMLDYETGQWQWGIPPYVHWKSPHMDVMAILDHRNQYEKIPEWMEV